MAMKHQENISTDSLIDKLIRVNGLLSKWDGRKAKAITSLVNQVFSVRGVCSDAHVKERVKQIIQYQGRLEMLQKIPVVEQRSPEWYKVRKEIITASDFAQALGEGKFGSQKQIYQKKCGYEEDKFNSNLPPLIWGTMFESVAADIYMIRNNCKLYDFGLLRHETVDFFGASPDGITDYGIMVEIKCPFKRKITGEIPAQYYYQIQGQLDVCGLSECDYLECEFSDQDTTDIETVMSDLECGIILEYEDPNSSSKTTYMYSKVVTKGELKELETTWVEESKANTALNFVRQHVWSLNLLNVVRVYKNDEFISEKMASLKEVWDMIKIYQSDKSLYLTDIGASKTTERRKKNIALTGYSFI